jgi:hypothetical protein
MSLYYAIINSSSPTYDSAAAKAAGEVLKVIPRVEPPRKIFVPPSVTARLVAKSPDPIASPSEIEVVRKLQTEHNHTVSFLLSCLSEHADAAWWKQQQAIEDSVRSGFGREASERDSWTREDFREDYEQKRNALKNTLRDISGRTAPIAFAIAERIGKLAANEADEIENREREIAAEWGIEFNPSRLLLSLRYVAAHHSELVPPPGANEPKVMLRFAGINL